jgi:hypothetical protein
MARNYSLTTIKTLFAEANKCAYPGCTEPLIFHDRGRTTAVAEVAHIRSETPGGPRYDVAYTGDVNGPENLLLLCGKHHRPVDRHESSYSVSELETWKAKQRASAGAGTALTESDLRSYARLTPEERQILMAIARLAQRVSGACAYAQQQIDAVRHENERARLAAAAQFGPMWEVDQGNRTLMGTDGFSLAPVEQREWDTKVRAIWDSQRPRAEQAQTALDEEIAVLRMLSGSLAAAADRVSLAAAAVTKHVGDATGLDGSIRVLQASVARLWQLANGDTDDNIPTSFT